MMSLHTTVLHAHALYTHHLHYLATALYRHFRTAAHHPHFFDTARHCHVHTLQRSVFDPKSDINIHLEKSLQRLQPHSQYRPYPLSITPRITNSATSDIHEYSYKHIRRKRKIDTSIYTPQHNVSWNETIPSATTRYKHHKRPNHNNS